MAVRAMILLLALLVGPVRQSQGQESSAGLIPFQPRQLTAEDYTRATSFIDATVRNDHVQPHWFGDGASFWYRRELLDGHEFQRVYARQRRRVPLFDHVKLARELNRISGANFAPASLPLEQLVVTKDGRELRFTAGTRAWTCTVPTYRCASRDAPSRALSISPDGIHAVFRRDRNLWLKDLATGAERALTQDGERYNEYGWVTGNGQYYVASELAADRLSPLVEWSPDSRYLLTHRIDERAVPESFMLQAAPPGSLRSRVHPYRQSIPGDPYPTTSYVIFDIKERRRIDVETLPNPYARDVSLEVGWVWWGPASTKLYFISHDRHFHKAQLCEIDARTGRIREVLEETSATSIALTGSEMSNHGQSVTVLEESQEVIWPSERDGWMHLYLYDLRAGKLKRRLTSGNWVVHGVIHVDPKRREVFFVGAGREPGRDPYYRHLYRVNLDGSGLRLLTPEDADHEIFGRRFSHAALQNEMHGPKVSPTGDFFVDTFSRVDTLPISILRSTHDDAWSMPLEHADAGDLLPPGFAWPRPFHAKADDAVTDLYGAVFLPRNFDAQRKYPVIDFIYAAPLYAIVDSGSFSRSGNGDYYKLKLAYAQLGFIAVNVNGRGSSGRSKAFRDFSYRNLQSGPGIADHVAAIRNLAREIPQLDLDRVGVTGFSFGGYNTPLAMMLYPQFFKVGVSGAGAMDLRGLVAQVLEKYQGEPGMGEAAYAPVALKRLASKLQGKLMIAYGEMDEHATVPPIVQYVDALIAANKDFDLLLMPNQPHGFATHPYFRRRQMDYFVRYLMGSEPPADFSFTAGH